VSGDAGFSPYLARGYGAEMAALMLAPEAGSGALWIEIPICFLEERDRP
jgi:hypothetical protein